MDPIGSVLILVNLVIGFGCAVPLTRYLVKSVAEPERFLRWFSLLIILYFVENLALIMGMGIPVLNVLLAFVWGFLFVRWFKTSVTRQEAAKLSYYLASYVALPTISLILIPIMAWLSGWHILTTTDGINFGIPDFLYLPWPVNTILGFYVVLILGAVALKTIITTRGVHLFLRYSRRGRSCADPDHKSAKSV